MRQLSVATVGLLLLACGGTRADRDDQAVVDSAVEAEATANPVVVLETNLGEMEIEVFPEDSPGTVENFLLHVRNGFYDGLIFHRVQGDFMIQTGGVTESLARRSSSIFPLANEADNGLSNVRGAVAMARMGDPHSATTEFFINVVDNPQLDFRDSTAQGFGYAVFGRVIDGMDVADSIAAIPTERRGRYADFPVRPVIIDRAYVK